MSEAKPNVPKLRFPGFTGPWEQRKLGDVGRAKSGVGFPESEQGGTSGVPFFKVSDMNRPGNETTLTVSANYVTEEQINKRGWKPVENVPAMFFAKVGAAVMLNRKRLVEKPFLLDNNTMAYSFDMSHWDKEFGHALFETVYLPSLCQVGALPSYNAPDVESLRIPLPPLPEQRAIGALFRDLDDLITLRQRELEHTKLMKRGLLQKMFPRSGSDVPELRFPSFTGPWEQRKLGELATFGKGFGFSKDDFRREGTQLLHYGRLYTDYQCVVQSVDTFADPIANAVYSEGDEVVTPSSGETAEDIAIASAVLSSGIMLGGGLNIIRPKGLLDSVFLALSISGGAQHRDLAKRAQGKSIVHLYNDDLADSRLAIPSNIEEQRAIGSLFRDLDDLITLRQRELLL